MTKRTKVILGIILEIGAVIALIFLPKGSGLPFGVICGWWLMVIAFIGGGWLIFSK